MIYRGDDQDDFYKIAFQRRTKKYFFLHWPVEEGMSEINHNLSYFDYKPIGPTMLVEWNDDL